MTLSRTDEIRQVASEWEFDKRIHAPRAARLLKELLRRVDELERGIGQMRLIAGLPLPPDVAAKVACVETADASDEASRRVAGDLRDLDLSAVVAKAVKP